MTLTRLDLLIYGKLGNQHIHLLLARAYLYLLDFLSPFSATTCKIYETCRSY